jgi:hypothetical protein
VTNNISATFPTAGTHWPHFTPQSKRDSFFRPILHLSFFNPRANTRIYAPAAWSPASQFVTRRREGVRRLPSGTKCKHRAEVPPCASRACTLLLDEIRSRSREMRLRNIKVQRGYCARRKIMDSQYRPQHVKQMPQLQESSLVKHTTGC